MKTPPSLLPDHYSCTGIARNVRRTMRDVSYDYIEAKGEEKGQEEKEEIPQLCACYAYLFI